jgi:hypothetical protein
MTIAISDENVCKDDSITLRNNDVVKAKKIRLRWN